MPRYEELVEALGTLGMTELRAWILAWARALPIVTIVPAFGLAAVALPIRLVLAAALALSAAPALRPIADGDAPFWVALLREAALGLPIALGAAALLWATVMAGGVVDNLRGTREISELPTLDEPSSPFAALFGLFAAIAFIEVGGVARLAAALAEPVSQTTWAVAANGLAASIGLAVVIAGPLVAGSVLIEVAGALIARAASPAFILPLLAPLRSVAVLAIVWLSFDRIATLLVLLASRG